MIEHVVRELWNNKIEQRCYNNHELGCCIKSGFASSNIREQPLSIHQVVYDMLKHDGTILIFYQSCFIMLTVLVQGCGANYSVIACDIFTRVYPNVAKSHFSYLQDRELCTSGRLVWPLVTVLDTSTPIFGSVNNRGYWPVEQTRLQWAYDKQHGI